MRTLISIVLLAFAALAISCDASSSNPADVITAPVSSLPHVNRSAPFDMPSAAPPPAKPDPRTPAELAQAACLGPNGQWHCKLQRKMVLAASSSSPIIPASWTVPNWYIDPSNSTGCASDSNSGTSSTCGAAGSGIGPLATWGELQVHRWGCQGGGQVCPRLQQTTTITW